MPAVGVGQRVWEPQSRQGMVLARSEREILYGGARFAGKTECGLVWMIEPEYVQNPLFRGLVIRKDYDDLSDWLFRARTMYGDMCEVVGHPAVMRWRAGGVTRIGHWKDRGTISKYVGQEYHKMLIEEANQTIPSLDDYNLLLGSVRSTVEGLRAQIFLTANPGGVGHKWLKEYFVKKAKNRVYVDPDTGSSRIFISGSYLDNEIGCQRDPEYKKWLEGLQGAIGKAWRDGDWDAFDGQFFETVGTGEAPYIIGPDKARGRIFGSLDIGLVDYTSFGLWYLDPMGYIHRLFTYKANGGTHRGHAEAIYQRIRYEMAHWTGGTLPKIVWAGHDTWRQTRVSNDYHRSPLDEYAEVFNKGRHVGEPQVQFVCGDRDRVNRCWTMKELFRETDGISRVYFWRPFNKTYEDDLQGMVADENNAERYADQAGDDTADEVGYGLSGIFSYVGGDIGRRRQQFDHFESVSTSWTQGDAMFSELGYDNLIRETSLR